MKKRRLEKWEARKRDYQNGNEIGVSITKKEKKIHNRIKIMTNELIYK